MTTAPSPEAGSAHAGGVAAVAFAEVDGRRVIVSADEGGMLSVGEVGSDAPARVLADAGGTPTAVAVASLGTELVVVTGRGDATLMVNDLRTGRPLHLLEGHTPGSYVTALAVFMLAGKAVVASADSAGQIILWDLLSGAPADAPRTPHTSGLPVFALAVVEARGQPVLVSGSRDGSVVASELRAWHPLWSASGPASVTGLAGWRYEGAPVVACAADDGTLVLRDPDKGHQLVAIGDMPRILALTGAFADGMHVLASGHDDGTLRLWREGRTDPQVVQTRQGAVRALALAGPGPLVAVGGDDGHVSTWDAPAASRPAPDKVDWLADAPGDADLLQRQPLATALARRLVRISETDGGSAFLVHLDGAWGTGKSTLLRFLRGALEPDWLVVEFDAWRQSRIGPPWWALLVALRDAIAAPLPRRRRTMLRLAESWRRIRRSGAPYLFALALLVAAVAGLLVLIGKPAQTWASLGDAAKSLSAVVAALGTLWAGGRLASRFLLWESAKGATMYEQSQAKPMESLADHFAWLLARAERPVVFFIDDLDRCPAEYVVELLEAVQTLIRGASDRTALQAGPYFVVAADGSWLRTSYEKHYAEFQGAVEEPGRPLGYLFLDKLFQLTVTVPRVTPEEKGLYLSGLLRTSRDGAGAPADVARVREQIKGSRTDEDVISALQDASPAARRVLAPEAVERLSAPAVEEATEHSLQGFAALLDPNPRAMKRFVNAYGIARVVLTLESTLVSSDTLALWTILRSRWPILAERLAKEPELIASIVSQTAPPADLPPDLRRLHDAGEVHRVVTFARGGPLTPDLIRAAAGGSAPGVGEPSAGPARSAANPSA